MLGLLSIQAAYLVNLELDVTAMEAIATATIEELEDVRVVDHAAPTHQRIEMQSLQHLTLDLSVEELLRRDEDPPHDESRSEGRRHYAVAGVLEVFLSRLDVSNLQIVLQLPDVPDSQRGGGGDGRGDGHGTGNLGDGTRIHEIEDALDKLRNIPEVLRLKAPGSQRAIKGIEWMWCAREDWGRTPLGSSVDGN